MNTRDAFRDAFRRCFLCGTLAINAWPPLLECHEISRGPARQKSLNERAALLMTCHACHEKHLDGMPVVTQLALKRIADPEGYDRIAVNRLRGRADDAITEAEVLTEVDRLESLAATNGGFPFLRSR